MTRSSVCALIVSAAVARAASAAESPMLSADIRDALSRFDVLVAAGRYADARDALFEASRRVEDVDVVGTIDEVRIYNRALSADEIVALAGGIR